MAHAHSPAPHSHLPAADESPASLLAFCRAAGLRRTHLLARVLEVLRGREEPVNIRDLQQTRGIKGVCSPVTLYRLLQRLEAIGLVRRIGLHERAAHFTLHRAHHHHDYVVCRDCGAVATLKMECPVEKLEREVGRRTCRFPRSQFTMNCMFFTGVCPACGKGR